jgi:hypothetical protein
VMLFTASGASIADSITAFSLVPSLSEAAASISSLWAVVKMVESVVNPIMNASESAGSK